MNSLSDIRSLFLDFFKTRHHQIMPSASLVPEHDPTLLFTNAGMVPFKDILTGRRKAPTPRAASAQKCIRAGGKHNDLDNVGYTARHHTFFEMLGNFSFGDYFKEQAISYAWDFITKELGVAQNRLWITVYADDEDSLKLWQKIAPIKKDRIIPIATHDNFWSMGAVGPCGPCSEIFYDHGDQIAGGPPGSADQDGDRFVEIWNLVFMQFERKEDGQQIGLPHPSIDTGMGLERVAAVMQGSWDNYQIDLFRHLIQALEDIIKIKAEGERQASFRVVADHLRAICFLIADGVQPDHEGRGYVLRRILRRAMRHLHLLGQTEPILYRLVPSLESEMSEAYPQLSIAAKAIEDIVKNEEERFGDMLLRGMGLLEKESADLNPKQKLSGEIAFKLYDTYGFPLDLTQDILRRDSCQVDVEGFERALERQRAQGRETWKGSGTKEQNQLWLTLADQKGASQFLGYERDETKGKIIAIVKNDILADEICEGEEGMILLDQTSFYAESGGQVGDKGVLFSGDNLFSVNDTQKCGDILHVHSGVQTKGVFKLKDRLTARIDRERRTNIRANHSATHLMHQALKDVLGNHVSQKGSLVDKDYLRFDFSHSHALSFDEIERVEAIVNAQIRLNQATKTQSMAQDEARQSGAIAMFGEKYDDEVRVLFMGETLKPSDKSEKNQKAAFSIEFCGGTHVKRLGDIALFKIIAQNAVGAGVRRITALTGAPAFEYLARQEQQLAHIAQLLKTSPDQLNDKIAHLVEENRALTRNLRQAKKQIMSSPQKTGKAETPIEMIGDIPFMHRVINGADSKELRGLVDEGKNQIKSGVVAMMALNKNRISLVIGVTKDLTDRLSAIELVKHSAHILGGQGGGGRDDFAQAGGSLTDKAPEAMKAIAENIAKAVAKSQKTKQIAHS